MQTYKTDLYVLRRILDALEAEQDRNMVQDARLAWLEKAHEADLIMFKARLEKVEARTDELCGALLRLNHERANTAQRARELEWSVDPYSLDGDAICNSGAETRE